MISELDFSCDLIGKLADVLHRVCQCDTPTYWMYVLPHLCATLLVVVRGVRRGGGE